MRKYPILFFVSLVVYGIHFFKVKHGIYGDGNGYFALAHTLFFQKSLNFAPIYNHLSNFPGSEYIFSRVFWDTGKTITGVLNCPWLIGTSLFWLPSFFIVAFVQIVSGMGINMYQWTYEFAVGVTGILLVIAGLFFLEKYLHEFVDKRTATLTVISLYFASQLFYYASFEPALSHQASFFLSSLFIYFTKSSSHKAKRAFFLGLILGLLFITRMGDIVLFLPLVLAGFVFFLKKKRFDYFLWMLMAFIIAIIPQFLLQQSMYGDFLKNAYFQGDKGTFKLFSIPSLINHLASPGGGFFLWSPLFIIGVTGLVRMISFSKYRSRIILFLLMLCGYVLFIASWSDIPPAGFGNRFLTPTIPLLGLGIAYMIKLQKKRILVIVSLCLIWNFLLLSQFFLDNTRLVKRKGLTLSNFITGQLSVPLSHIRVFRLVK